MTIDEITAALEEWRGDDEDRSYTLIALNDRKIKVATKGNDFLLGYSLAGAMKSDKGVKRVVQMATMLEEIDL